MVRLGLEDTYDNSGISLATLFEGKEGMILPYLIMSYSRHIQGI